MKCMIKSCPVWCDDICCKDSGFCSDAMGSHKDIKKYIKNCKLRKHIKKFERIVQYEICRAHHKNQYFKAFRMSDEAMLHMEASLAYDDMITEEIEK